jgi:aerobic C4-dicarboxylate transport protein
MRIAVRSLYFWVLVGVLGGALLGSLYPEFGTLLKPLGDGFVKLVRMVVGPIVFCTVVLGIAQARDLRQVGRLGVKALIYFEILSTLALILGLVFAHLFHPGSSMHISVQQLDDSAVVKFVDAAHAQSIIDFLFNVIPTTIPSALTSGEILQVLLVALLIGFGVSIVGEKAAPLLAVVEALSAILFKVVSLLMWLAPLGAFGAMAYTIGKFGWAGLAALSQFMGVFYLVCVLFVLMVLGTVARLAGFRITHLIRYLRTEIVTVIGTSSSESVLAVLMAKLERLGCQRSTIGVVVPTGYSFNLDGTCIYLSLAAIFLAQALEVRLTITQEITLLLVAMLSSKGSATITGGGFITLAATLAVVPDIPVAALSLILGIDRFMSEARAVTNLLGNAVATIVISRWEGEVSAKTLAENLNHPTLTAAT